jgi:hypothetical protein
MHSSVASREFSECLELFEAFFVRCFFLIFHSNEYVITAAFYNCSPLFSAAESLMQFSAQHKEHEKRAR